MAGRRKHPPPPGLPSPLLSPAGETAQEPRGAWGSSLHQGALGLFAGREAVSLPGWLWALGFLHQLLTVQTPGPIQPPTEHALG